jgi:hypothetical protein
LLNGSNLKQKNFQAIKIMAKKLLKNENLMRCGVNVTLLFLLQSVGGRGTTNSQLKNKNKKHLLCSVCQAGIQGNSI